MPVRRPALLNSTLQKRLGTSVPRLPTYLNIIALSLAAAAILIVAGPFLTGGPAGQALTGLAVAIPCYAGYNYLVSRVNAIVLDMEKAAGEIVNIVSDSGNGRNE